MEGELEALEALTCAVDAQLDRADASLAAHKRDLGERMRDAAFVAKSQQTAQFQVRWNLRVLYRVVKPPPPCIPTFWRAILFKAVVMM